mgnify:FL=1
MGFSNPFLFIIAFFVFFVSRAEAAQVAAREKLGNMLVRDGMVRNFRALDASLSVGDALAVSFSGMQQDYPVVDNGLFLGMVPRDELLTAAQQSPQMRVSDVAQTSVTPVGPSDRLVSIFERAPMQASTTMPVVESGELIGLLNLHDAAMRAQARESMSKTAPPASPLLRPPASHISS